MTTEGSTKQSSKKERIKEGRADGCRTRGTHGRCREREGRLLPTWRGYCLATPAVHAPKCRCVFPGHGAASGIWRGNRRAATVLAAGTIVMACTRRGRCAVAPSVCKCSVGGGCTCPPPAAAPWPARSTLAGVAANWHPHPLLEHPCAVEYLSRARNICASCQMFLIIEIKKNRLPFEHAGKTKSERRRRREEER